MSRFDYDFSDRKLQRYINEGRGQGRGSAFEPFLKVNSISSKGRTSRVSGWKTGRVHHFLSDNETRYFYLCEWSDAVIDIREHFPLLDLVEMTEILDETLIKKIVNQKNGTPVIFTSTFLITVRNGQGEEIHFARNIKEARELEKPNVIDRYEIIRRYWHAKGIDWKLVTPTEINAVRAKNIEWLHTARRLSDWGYGGSEEVKLNQLLELLRSGNEPIRNVIERFEEVNQSERGEGLLLFKHLLATKKIKIDMDKLIDLNQFVEQVTINLKGSEIYKDVVGH